MATYTPNLNLEKPEASDEFKDFRASYNGNMDIIDQALEEAGTNLAEFYDHTATYSVGDYVVYEGILYKCDTAVTVAETFDPTKWTQVAITDEMGGGGGGDVMDVEVNGVSVLDPDDKIAKITSYKEVTQAEYDALPASKTSDGVAYFIKDSGSIDSYFTVINGVPYVIFDDGN